MITPDNPKSPQLTLSPCPFCGQGAPVVWLYRDRQWRANGPKWVAHCKSCNVTKEGRTQLQAVAAWNTRSTAVEPPSTSFECMIYDAHLPSMTARFRIPEGLPFASGMYEIRRVRCPTAEDIARWAHLPEPPDEDEQGEVERGVATPVDDDVTRAFIDGWNARFDHTDFDMALHYWMLSGVTVQPPEVQNG